MDRDATILRDPQPIDKYISDFGFIRLTKAAEALGVTRNVLYAAIEAKQLPVRYAGRCCLIARDDLVGWLDSLPSVSPYSKKGQQQIE